MSKRFIDTSIWTQNRWFRKLKPKDKLFWIYLFCHCDNVGVWEEDFELASFIIGDIFTKDEITRVLGDKIKWFTDKKLWIVDFCEFQYGELVENNIKNKPHQAYINTLKKHSLWIDYQYSINRVLEKEQEKEVKEEEYEEKETNGYITPKLFETFWKLYPKKIDKGKALSSWNKICTRKNITPPVWKELRIALHHQKQSERWKDKTFIPHPTTWLNQSRWLDNPLEMKNFGDRDKENFKCLFGGKFGEGFNPSVERCRNCEEDESKLYRRCRLEFSQLKQVKA
jgi:hypothetical protein